MALGEPLSTRAARMKLYNDLISQLDSGGAHYSQDLSEVDLSDPDDLKVITSDPQGEVLVHLGSSNYLERYKVFVAHVQEWRQQFAELQSVDLRYDRQVIVNPDLRGSMPQAKLPASALKAAIKAGVKPAALKSSAGFSSKASGSAQQAKAQARSHARPAGRMKRLARSAATRSIPPTVAQAPAAQSASKPSPAIVKGQDSP
jgi:cell division protein FtsQ